MNKVTDFLSWVASWVTFVILVMVAWMVRFTGNAYGLGLLCGMLYVVSAFMLFHAIAGYTLVFVLAVIITCMGLFAEACGIIE